MIVFVKIVLFDFQLLNVKEDFSLLRFRASVDYKRRKGDLTGHPMGDQWQILPVVDNVNSILICGFSSKDNLFFFFFYP